MRIITLTGFRTEYGWARNTIHHATCIPSGIQDEYARLVLGGEVNTFQFEQVGEFHLPEGEPGAEAVPVVLFGQGACVALKDLAVPVVRIGEAWERDRSRLITNEFGGISRNIHLPALGASFALSDEEA